MPNPYTPGTFEDLRRRMGGNTGIAGGLAARNGGQFPMPQMSGSTIAGNPGGSDTSARTVPGMGGYGDDVRQRTVPGGTGSPADDLRRLGGPFPEFTPPTVPDLERFKAPAPFAFGNFAHEGFRAPTMQEAESDPGYQFALDQGRKALEQSAVNKGKLFTGQTLKDILGFGQQAATQQYGTVYNRQADTYDRNRANAFGTCSANRANEADAYATNYGVARDAWDRNTNLGLDLYDRQFQGEQAAFNPRFRAAELSFDDLYRRDAMGNEDKWRGVDEAYRRWRDQLNAMLGLATMPPLG